jgi:DNA-binding transcriptional MerR regulator
MPRESGGKNQNRLFGSRDAAAELGIDTTTLRAMEKRGDISPLRTSTGHRVYSPEDLAAVRAYRESRSAAP